MAQRPRNQSGNGEGFSRSTAEDVVFGNLELEGELGNGADDDNENELDLDDDQELDLDGDQDDDDPFDPGESELDDDGEPLRDLRVSHTGERQPKKEQKKPLPRRSEVTTDKNGNLVDKNGKIVARGGVQARLYQKAETRGRQLRDAQAQNTDLTSRLSRLAGIAKNLHTQVETYKGTEAKMKEFGLTPQKQLNAMQLFVDLETNPAQTIKRILTRAAQGGIDIAQLGAGGSGATDVKALSDMVKDIVSKEVGPLKERAQKTDATEQEQETKRRELAVIQQETAEFFQRNPRAEKYMPLFRKALAHPRYRVLSLPEIWAKILENLATRGDGRQRSRTPDTGRSIPRGRGAAPGGNSNLADPSRSYGDILTDVIRQHGVPERV